MRRPSASPPPSSCCRGSPDSRPGWQSASHSFRMRHRARPSDGEPRRETLCSLRLPEPRRSAVLHGCGAPLAGAGPRRAHRRRRARPSPHSTPQVTGREVVGSPKGRLHAKPTASITRNLTRADETRPPPPDAQQPSAWRRHRGRIVGPREGEAPAVEPSPGRRRVDSRRRRECPAALPKMPPRIEEHVRDRVPDLTRRSQDVEVVSVGEYRAAPPEDSVHGTREARSDRLHSRRKILLARRLHDQVSVIGLERVVGDAEAPALARGAQASLELPDESHVAQRRKAAPRLERDVARESGGEGRPSAARVPRVLPRLSTSPGTAATPGRRVTESECELSRLSCHRR